jgi:hypothetical protein
MYGTMMHVEIDQLTNGDSFETGTVIVHHITEHVNEHEAATSISTPNSISIEVVEVRLYNTLDGINLICELALALTRCCVVMVHGMGVEWSGTFIHCEC